MARSKALSVTLASSALLVVALMACAPGLTSADRTLLAEVPSDPTLARLCQTAEQSLPNDPNAAAFRQCATQAVKGGTMIPRDCCSKLSPLASYLPCLDFSRYSRLVNDNIAPVTIDKARADCAS